MANRICKECKEISDHPIEWEIECPHCGGTTLDLQGAGDRINELESLLREVTVDDNGP